VKILPLLAAAALALPAAAQDGAAPLIRAELDAKALVAADPVSVPGARSEPDDDASVDPEDLSREPLGNFHPVTDGIFRSALPSPAGYPQLKKMGFKTILNLQESAGDEAKKAGPEIRVVHVAMSGLKKPTFEQMDRALEVLATAERPILAHCTHGKDRTGFVIASWRVVVEKRPIAEAVEEARGYGCCFVMFGDLADYLRDYGAYRRALRLK
jgi:tyrosine-protein phosphatase SIW14